MSVLRSLLLTTLCLLLIQTARAADAPASGDLGENDPLLALQGEYTGEVQTDKGPVKVGVQVIALGGDSFRSVGYVGGLPGEGWNQSERVETAGQHQNGTVTFQSDTGTGSLQGGVLTISNTGGEKIGELKRVERTSPTLGAKPPEGAVVLFDGTSADNFEPGRLAPDGALMQGANSKHKFQSCTLHLEFRTPFQPGASGQGRGNSGCYLQGRYEVQILDSFGLKGEHNECGGIYSVRAPSVNMCYPPTAWQTYDIDFTAATFDASGAKTKNASLTVRHNGVLIHENVEVDHATTASILGEGPEPGPLHLQDHGNPVRFRNIWLVEKKAENN